MSPAMSANSRSPDLTAVPGKLVNVPRVGGKPGRVRMQADRRSSSCRAPTARRRKAWLTLGEVVAVHIDKAMIKDGVYLTALAHPIVRAGRRGDYFKIKPEDMFEMVRPD